MSGRYIQYINQSISHLYKCIDLIHEDHGSELKIKIKKILSFEFEKPKIKKDITETKFDSTFIDTKRTKRKNFAILFLAVETVIVGCAHKKACNNIECDLMGSVR